MTYKAIFFDRDNTLTYANEEIKNRKKQLIESWIGKEFKLDYDRTMNLFEKANYPKGGLKSVEDEIIFWKRYYYELLKDEGVLENIEEKAEMIHNELWLKEKALFPEVIEVLEYFKTHGYKIGVISDTSPSLQLTLETLGIGKYFDCYICSDLVGVMKPDEKIYKAALSALNVEAKESIYVDDYDVEADGARILGFTSFHIDRKNSPKSQWDINSLKEIINYVESK